MKIKTIFALPLCGYLSAISQSCELSIIDYGQMEKHRIGNIVQGREEISSSFPPFASLGETLSFAENLIASEKEFWVDCQQGFCEQHKEIKVIASILENPKYKLDLNMRFNLLQKDEDICNYDIYKSYGVVIKVLNEYWGYIKQYKERESIPADEAQTLNNMILELNAINRDSRQKNRLIRRLATHSIVPSIQKMLDETINYMYCDVEYVTDEFFPLLMNSLCARLDILPKPELKMIEPEIVRKKNQGKRKNGKNMKSAQKNKSKSNFSPNRPSGPKAKKSTAPGPLAIIPTTPPSADTQDDFMPEITAPEAQAAQEGPSGPDEAVLMNVAASSDAQNDLIQNNAREERTDAQADVAEKEILPPENEEFDLRPWEKYTYTADAQKQPTIQPSASVRIIPTLKYDHIETGMALLNMGRQHALAPVKMSMFISGGTGTQRKINLHKKMCPFSSTKPRES